MLGPADTPDVTVASLVPTQLARLIHRPPPPSLQCVMLGGAPADPTLLVRAREAGWPVRPSYGLTQACSAVTLADVGDVDTSGRPLPGLSVSLAEDGEIIVAGPSVVGGVARHRRPRCLATATGWSCTAARSTRSSAAGRT